MSAATPLPALPSPITIYDATKFQKATTHSQVVTHTLGTKWNTHKTAAVIITRKAKKEYKILKECPPSRARASSAHLA